MANTFNYAEKYSSDIIEIINQNALTSPFLTSNVEWTGAKTFHFTQMSVSGYKAHSRNGGWNSGTITQTDKTYEVTHDRDVKTVYLMTYTKPYGDNLVTIRIF